jgi:four helix bundle protein
MDRAELEQRTKRFGLRVLKLGRAMMKGDVGRILARQVIRSGTSIGANYRAAGRARSRAEFVSKLGVAEEEADETVYWLELIMADEQLVKADRIADLLDEAKQLTAIIAAARMRAKRN